MSKTLRAGSSSLWMRSNSSPYLRESEREGVVVH